MTTLKSALDLAIARLEAKPIGPPRLAAEALMQHTLSCDKAHLYAHPERKLTPEEMGRYQTAISRRASGEPLQYITGHQEFFGLDFLVTPAVLIPRPETEHLVEAALAVIKLMASGSDALRMVDVGVGSGAVVLALAHELSRMGFDRAELHATDISPEALAVARQNAQRLGITNVCFHETDLLAALAGLSGSFDVVVSNPPYVGWTEQDKVQREVREHEPHVAVFGGAEGLDIYRRLVPQARALLKPAGWLMMEIGYSIERSVRSLLSDWHEVSAVADLQGIPRVVQARRPK